LLRYPWCSTKERRCAMPQLLLFPLLPLHWLRVSVVKQLLALVMVDANRGIREEYGQKNMWHSVADA